MNKINKTLLIAGIICVVSCAVSILLYFKANNFLQTLGTTDGLAIFEMILSLVTGIIYIVYSTLPGEKIAKSKNVFFVMLILNIFNGILVWAVAFWVDIAVSNFCRYYAYQKYQQMQKSQNAEFNFTSNAGQTEQKTSPYMGGNSGTIVLDPSDYRVVDKIEAIRKELNALDEKRRNNEITEEEYNRLRNEIINRQNNY